MTNQDCPLCGGASGTGGICAKCAKELHDIPPPPIEGLNPLARHWKNKHDAAEAKLEAVKCELEALDSRRDDYQLGCRMLAIINRTEP